MYHISNDKRSAKSADLIYQGLLNCLEKKPFDQITVTEVQRSSGVARTTIYRCFDHLSDVLYWRCDRCFYEALHPSPATQPRNEVELIHGYFTYWTEHSDILKLLVDIDRQDMIYACHRKNAEILEETYGSLPGMSEAEARYFMAIRTGVTISVLKAWLEGGKRETPDDLTKMIQRLLFDWPEGACFKGNALLRFDKERS